VSYLKTAYALGVKAADDVLNKEASKLENIKAVLSFLTPTLAGGSVGAATGALTSAEGERGTGALRGGALGALLGAGGTAAGRMGGKALGESAGRSLAESNPKKLRELMTAFNRKQVRAGNPPNLDRSHLSDSINYEHLTGRKGKTLGGASGLLGGGVAGGLLGRKGAE